MSARPDKPTQAANLTRWGEDSAAARKAAGAQPSAADVARYVAEMSAQMAQLADAAHLEMLAYFLDMARVESEIVLRRLKPDSARAP